MPASVRRKKIESLLAEDPQDSFLRYGLAMELDKEGEHEPSLAHLRDLMADAPPYVPAFFMAGQQLARLDRLWTRPVHTCATASSKLASKATSTPPAK